MLLLPKRVHQNSISSFIQPHGIFISFSHSQRNSILGLVRMSMLSSVVLLFVSHIIPCVTSFEQQLSSPISSSSLLWSSSFIRRRYYYGDDNRLTRKHNGGINTRAQHQRVRQPIIALRSTVAPLPPNTNQDDDTSIPQSNIRKRQESPCSNTNQDDDGTTEHKKGMSIYVHIPYCRKRCRYCDFAIVPIGTSASWETTDDDNETNSLNNDRAKRAFQKMDASYRDAIVSEIDLISKYANTSTSNTSEKNTSMMTTTTTTTTNKIPLRSIYFGGGTPSLAPLGTLQSILDAIINSPDSAFYYYPDSDKMEPMEITIEMDPGTFSLSKLHALKSMGFNRISLGVQSFDDSILESIGRVHRYQDIMDAVDMIGQVFGGEDCVAVNYSLDLISGLPGLSCAKWIETLQMALELEPPPDHLSLYDLQVESGTVFGKWYEDAMLDEDDDRGGGDGGGGGEDARTSGDISRTRLVPTIDTAKNGNDRIPLPTAEDCAFMYRFASGYLRSKGFEHYEISSYARVANDNDDDSIVNSKRSRHNQVY